MLNVLKPPQKPIISKGCSQTRSGFLENTTTSIASNNEAEMLEIKVASGKNPS